MKDLKSKGCPILDVGSGSRRAYTDSENVLHLDIEDKNCDIQGDIFHLPFADNSYDIVYASHLFEHLANPFQALQEIKRVAKYKIIIRVPNLAYYRFDDQKGHIIGWTRQLLQQFLDKAEFKKVIVKENVMMDRHGLKKYLLMLVLHKDELTAMCIK
jgi:ubiquinone/menaquinone biosynthesis C-methylase UbiE